MSSCFAKSTECLSFMRIASRRRVGVSACRHSEFRIRRSAFLLQSCSCSFSSFRPRPRPRRRRRPRPVQRSAFSVQRSAFRPNPSQNSVPSFSLLLTVGQPSRLAPALSQREKVRRDALLTFERSLAMLPDGSSARPQHHATVVSRAK